MTVEKILFVDLDKTLITRRSHMIAAFSILRANRTNVRELLRAIGMIPRIGMALAVSTLDFIGFPLASSVFTKYIMPLTDYFYSILHLKSNWSLLSHECQRYTNPHVLAHILQHRDENTKVYILSTTFNELVQEVVKDFGFDGGWGSEYFTSPIQLMHGKEKLAKAEELCEEHGVSLESCFFYSDSISDLPLLNAAGKSFFVRDNSRFHTIPKTLQRPYTLITHDGACEVCE